MHFNNTTMGVGVFKNPALENRADPEPYSGGVKRRQRQEVENSLPQAKTDGFGEPHYLAPS